MSQSYILERIRLHWKKSNWAERIAWFLHLYNRGNSLFEIPLDMVRLFAYTSMIALALVTIKDNFFYVLIIGPLVILGFVSIAAIDYKKGFWRTQNRITFKELNPHTKGMDDKLDWIVKEIKTLKALYISKTKEEVR